MVGINDIKGYEDRLKNGLRLLLESDDITEAERERIREFVEYQDSSGLAVGTNAHNLSRIRLFAERSDRCMTEMSKTDVDSMLFEYKHADEYGYSEGTIREDQKSLRKFFRWLGRSWAEDIEISPRPDPSVDEDRIFSAEESSDLLAACRNPRDKALVAFLLDTGVRVGAAGTLRVGDIDLSGRAGKFSLNEDAVALKGASGTRPLTWSRGYIANWLDVHPQRDDPGAPLFHKLVDPDEDGRGDATVDSDGALSYNQILLRLKGVAERAGIDRDRANPHNFRHTAITRWIKEGLSDQEIKHRAFWSKNSDRLFKVYSHVEEGEMNDQILAQYGLDGDGDEVTPELDECVQCGTPLRGDGTRFCPGCGAPLSYHAAEAIEDAEDTLVEDIADNPELADELLDLREFLSEKPELRDSLVDEFS